MKNNAKRINLGQYYTPLKYINVVNWWLVNHGVTNDFTIADLSCGDGRFLQLPSYLSNPRIGNDIDKKSIDGCIMSDKMIAWFNKNALLDISRKEYGISENSPLVIVGNPPYNDTTSQSKMSIKKSVEIDKDIKSRDIGMSSMLAYNKLKADYVAILHPLSYLVKETNFNILSPFMKNYQIVEQVVFPSTEFDSVSTMSPFPILCILYKRLEGCGMTYKDIKQFKFKTIDDIQFSLSDYDYITDYIQKYPHHKRYSKEILFYTLRDINALMRSKTFISKRCGNAVDVDPDKLSYYCYIDCFKHYAKVPYYFGNFNIPFKKEEFEELKQDITTVSKFNNKNIFTDARTPTEEQLKRVENYFKQLF